ncbi:MAG: hypothetical protein JRJ78_14110 [Deltaproteobacteria bacterium]|nr:hypothetical protein [Deltaproteobacteria bacterium]
MYGIEEQERMNSERGYARFDYIQSDRGYIVEVEIYSYENGVKYGFLTYHRPTRELTVYIRKEGVKYIPQIIDEVNRDFGHSFGSPSIVIEEE